MAKKAHPWPTLVAGAPWARLLKPAPGDLRVIQALANSFDPRSQVDEIATTGALVDWLACWRLPPADTSRDDDLRRFHQLRRDLRSLIAANPDRKPDPEAIARLDRAAEAALFRLRFDARGTTRLESTVSDFTCRLLAIVRQAQVDETWRQLRLCHDEHCPRVFYDRSANRHGRWCGTRCANRHNMRVLRKRGYRD